MGLFTSKKKKLLETGVLAEATLKDVRDTGVTINNNPQVRLVLEVQPKGAEAFEASVKKVVSRVGIPQPGTQFLVRYDPADRTKVVIDQNAIAEYNQTADAVQDQAAANQTPPELLEHGVPGRVMITAVEPQGKNGNLIQTKLSVTIRLVDGTGPYKTTINAALAPKTIAEMQSAAAIVPFPVRVDPADHERAALSLGEPVPVVPYPQSEALDGWRRALASGTPRRITLLELQRQYLRVPSGEEIYSLRVRLDDGREVLVATVLVPADVQWLVTEGRELPARVLAAEPNVLAIDWDSARREAGATVTAAS